MDEVETICPCSFQTLLSEILFEIKSDNMLNNNECNLEQLSMMLHIAICLGTRVFGVRMKTVKKFLKRFNVNITVNNSTTY